MSQLINDLMQVMLVNATELTQSSQIYRRTGSAGNLWRKATVDVGQQSAGMKVNKMRVCVYLVFIASEILY